jgi:hypothetical protein
VSLREEIERQGREIEGDKEGNNISMMDRCTKDSICMVITTSIIKGITTDILDMTTTAMLILTILHRFGRMNDSIISPK